MNFRRDFLRTLLAFAACTPFAALATRTVKRMTRASVFDPDFGPDKYCRVFLNGVQVECNEADEKRGYVIAPVRDKRGALQLNAEKTDILRQWRYGHVRIEKIE